QGGSTSAGRGGTGHGGGIVNVGSTLTVIHSVLADNRAIGGTGGSGFQTGFGLGGGIADLAGGTVTVRESTLTRHEARGAARSAVANGGDGLGGGVYLDSSSTVAVASSAITDNEAEGGGKGKGGSQGRGIGGGVYSLGTFTFDSRTVIADNEASTSNDDIFP